MHLVFTEDHYGAGGVTMKHESEMSLFLKDFTTKYETHIHEANADSGKWLDWGITEIQNRE